MNLGGELWRDPFFEGGVIDCQDHRVSGEEFAGEFDADGAIVFEADGGHAGAEADVFAGEGAIEFAEGAGGGAHFVCGVVREHSFLEDLDGV